MGNQKDHFGDQQALPCTIFRGGTSKGVLFLAKDLPVDRSKLVTTLVRIMGSPDSRQIDGLGGADPLTSKIAIISSSSLPDIDVEYVFGQVSIQKTLVEFTGFCGNIIAAAGPFAINEGLVHVHSPITEVSIFDVNTKTRVLAKVPVKEGKAQTRGNFSIAGVSNLGACIELDICDPVGKITGTLLPTKNVVDSLETSFGVISVSLVDCVDPVVFVRAKDMGLSGKEVGKDLEEREGLLERLEELRQLGAKKMKIDLSANLPKIIFVAPLSPFRLNHLFGRMIALKKMHKAYAVSSAACTAVAALLPRSIPNEAAKADLVCNGKSTEGSLVDKITIHHPLGEMEVFVTRSSSYQIEKVTLFRTARCLMKGVAMV